MIHSDWHIHSEHSYDASLPLEKIASGARGFGFHRIGITDHLNFNDAKFVGDLKASCAAVKEIQKKYSFVTLGVELTPIELPEFEYIRKTGTREGYTPPSLSRPFDIELAMSREELMSLGVRYAIGAAHWRVDVPYAKKLTSSLDELIRELYEAGIPITYGSDSHNEYPPSHKEAEKYLAAAGFADGDISEISEEHFWQVKV